jgi:hypothetical protein
MAEVLDVGSWRLEAGGWKFDVGLGCERHSVALNDKLF